MSGEQMSVTKHRFTVEEYHKMGERLSRSEFGGDTVSYDKRDSGREGVRLPLTIRPQDLTGV